MQQTGDSKMCVEEVKTGAYLIHKYLGGCTVLKVFKSGAVWIQVWGGPNGDKLITFRGQRVEDLSKKV